MKSIEFASRKLFFADAQPDNQQPSATALFVHGAGGSHLTWRSQLEGLCDRFRIIAVDLPGHGLSEGEGESTIAGYAACVVALMDTLGLENVALGGHSMGGAVALEIALRRPERLGGLILAGTGARLRVMPTIFSTIREDFDAAVGGMATFLLSPEAPPDLIDEQKRLLAENPADVLIGDFTACDAFDVVKELDAISLPTLILCGRQDMLTPVKYSEFLRDKMADAEAVFLDDSGHMPMIEKGDEFNEAVAAFLTRLS